MLAVTLGHLESARSLLNSEANVNCENSNGWTGMYNEIIFIILVTYLDNSQNKLAS